MVYFPFDTPIPLNKYFPKYPHLTITTLPEKVLKIRSITPLWNVNFMFQVYFWANVYLNKVAP